MIYRKWELKDIGEVVELEKKCFSDPWNADMVLSSFNQPRFIGFVAEENGKVTAYLGATAILSDSDVLLVAVDENYRKKGVATALFKLLFTTLKEKGAEKVFLEVRSKNIPGRAGYTSLGFSAISLRHNYYCGGGAIIMEKDL